MKDATTNGLDRPGSEPGLAVQCGAAVPQGGAEHEAVARALRRAASCFEHQPRVAELAQAAGLSATRFARACRAQAGISPKSFVQVLTLAAARRHLARGETVLATSLAVGLSGGGRLHDLFTGIERLTPGEYARGGAGLKLAWDEAATPCGPALACSAPRGLCHLAFTAGRGLEAELARARARWPRAEFQRDPRALAPAFELLAARLAGGLGDPRRPVTLLLAGTDFELRVWEALLAIPAGSTVAYGHIARAIGAPSAARAVGRAVGANPIAVLIPCHRVIRASGALAGYRWGESTKRALLAAEGATLAAR
ncbi:MAG: methylated-DNA--[protein]-cysteine S-methyltransferase [Planctomycetes bacterium]|nr:methylated-DNA--[protein]-cysteine S-methyltransferase [Planctomycetota bacterium]